MPDNTYIVPENAATTSGRLSELIEYAVDDVFNTFLSKAKIEFKSVSDLDYFCTLMKDAIDSIDIEGTHIESDKEPVKPAN